MINPTVFILCGLIGSGKSTHAKRILSEHPDTLIVNRDALREMAYGGYSFIPHFEPLIKRFAFSMVSSCISRGISVVVDETNLTVKKRQEIIDECTSTPFYGPLRIVCVWCREGVRNLEFRMREPRGCTREKWEEVLDSMRKSFEPPTMEEGFDEIIEVTIPEGA